MNTLYFTATNGNTEQPIYGQFETAYAENLLPLKRLFKNGEPFDGVVFTNIKAAVVRTVKNKSPYYIVKDGYEFTITKIR